MLSNVQLHVGVFTRRESVKRLFLSKILYTISFEKTVIEREGEKRNSERGRLFDVYKLY